MDEYKIMSFPGSKDEKVVSNESTPLISSSGKSLNIEEALDSLGVGFFHVILILVTGWALASDSVEILCIGFVSPQLTSNITNPDLALKPNKVEEGFLDGVIFAGMMVGGYFWGSFSDVVGRRSCLITSLTVNAIFGFASSLSPHYGAFLFFRFMSGVGVGGSLPVAFSYFCEFFTRKTRGPFVIIVASFWTFGQVFAAVLAMVILDNAYIRENVNIAFGLITITPWRVYVMLCTIPCLTAALFMLFLPESPYFLYTKNKLDETMDVLKRIRRLNKICYCSKKRLSGDLPPLIPPPMKETYDSELSRMRRFLNKLLIIFKSTVELFRWAYIRPTVVLIIVYTTFSFGYYGLLLWFPEYFRCVYQNQNNCTYSLSEPDSCAPNVSRLCNDTTGSSIYLDNLYTALATIPTTVLGIVTVNILGGKLMLALSVFVCGLSVFLIRIVPATENITVILSCIFNGVAIFGWNALDVITTSELFPVHLRSTAFGIQSVLGRVGAILGNVLFGRLITVDPLIPIAMVAVVLMFGGLVGFALPSPRGHSMKRVFSRCCCLCRQGERCKRLLSSNDHSPSINDPVVT